MNQEDRDLASRTAVRLRAAGCVFAEDEARLLVDQAADNADLEAMLVRRTAGVPLEVVLGWTLFCGLRIEVAPGVFVPRRRTEFLVEQAISYIDERAVVVDLCCGTGAVGRAIAEAMTEIELHSSDIDPVATACAAGNVAPVDGHIHRGDLFAALPHRLRGGVDLVVVNAPYVPTDEIAFMPTEARTHEPHHTLDGGPDGVTVHRRVGAEVVRWLRSGGHVLVETSQHLADRTAAALTDGGLSVVVRSDVERGATVVVASYAQ